MPGVKMGVAWRGVAWRGVAMAWRDADTILYPNSRRIYDCPAAAGWDTLRNHLIGAVHLVVPGTQTPEARNNRAPLWGSGVVSLVVVGGSKIKRRAALQSA